MSTYPSLRWRDAKWIQCLEGDDPRGDCCCKIFTSERAAGFVLLEVSCGPIVQQDKPKNMILCTVNVNCLSKLTSLPNDRGKLDFKVEFLTEPR